ncbi:MAG TPA: hypothetical protein PLP17_09400, partial [Oligoflexia bacterium]|nr:hypothetical protein [Oligoflexia bacterium]
METAVQGGYRVIRAGELISLIEARKAGDITFTALRAYLGCHILAASRAAAAGRFNASGPVRYTLKELHQRLGKDISEEAITSALEQLERRELLKFREEGIEFLAAERPHWSAAAELHTDPARPVPIPRFILRAILRHKKPAEVLAVLAHLVRCLWKKGKEIVSKGLVKASWVARLCGISERAVHGARRWMQEKKFLTVLEVKQQILNRFGGCFVIALQHEGERCDRCGGKAAKRRVPHNSKRSRVAGKSKNEFAPPYKQVHSIKSTSTTNQKDNPAFGKSAGFLSRNSEKPTLKDIKLDDLHRLSRLEELYQQATAANWLLDCEANLRNFVAAAVRATRVSGDAVRIFVGIVKKGLFHHITQAEEDRAVQALKRYREKRTGRHEGRKAGMVANAAEVCRAGDIALQLVSFSG